MNASNCTTLLPTPQNGSVAVDISGELTRLRELIAANTTTVIVAWCVVVVIVSAFIGLACFFYRHHRRSLLLYRSRPDARQGEGAVCRGSPPELEEVSCRGSSHDDPDDRGVSRVYCELRDSPPPSPSLSEPQEQAAPSPRLQHTAPSPSPQQTPTTASPQHPPPSVFPQHPPPRASPQKSLGSHSRGKAGSGGDIELQEMHPAQVAAPGRGAPSRSHKERLKSPQPHPRSFPLDSSQDLHQTPASPRPKLLRVHSVPADPSHCPPPPPCGLGLSGSRRVLSPPLTSPATGSRVGLSPLIESQYETPEFPPLNETPAPSTAPAALTRTMVWSKPKGMPGSTHFTPRGAKEGEATSARKDQAACFGTAIAAGANKATDADRDKTTSDETDKETGEESLYEALYPGSAVSSKYLEVAGRGEGQCGVPSEEECPSENWYQNDDSLPPPSAFAVDDSELLELQSLPPAPDPPPPPRTSSLHSGVPPTVTGGKGDRDARAPPPPPRHHAEGRASERSSPDDGGYLPLSTAARLRSTESGSPGADSPFRGEDLPRSHSSKYDSGVADLMASPHTSSASNPDVRAVSGEPSGVEDTYTIRIASPTSSFQQRPLPTVPPVSGQAALSASQKDIRSGLGPDPRQSEHLYEAMSRVEQEELSAERTFGRKNVYPVPRQIFDFGRGAGQRTAEGIYDVPPPPSCQPTGKSGYVPMASPSAGVHVPAQTEQAAESGVSGDVDLQPPSHDQGSRKEEPSVADLPTTPPAGDAAAGGPLYDVPVPQSAGSKRYIPPPPSVSPPPLPQKSLVEDTTYDVPRRPSQSSVADSRL